MRYAAAASGRPLRGLLWMRTGLLKQAPSVYPVRRTGTQQALAMNPIDRAIIDYIKSRKGIIGISLGLTVCGIIFILLTGRYDLSWWIGIAILPWVEYWLRRRKK
jgi:hypothetical protein